MARGLPLIIIIIALAALVLSSVGHAQDLDPVLVSNTGQTAGSDLATAPGRVSYAQSFTTGEHPDGYFLSSVEVGLKADSGVTAEVALWRTTRTTSERRIGFYFIPQRILTTLSGVPSIDNDAATLERFSANDVLLLPGTTYWIVVTRTGGADDGLSVATTSSEDAVDAGGMAGFSVGNNVWVPDPDHIDEWADYSGSVDASMKIGLRGSEATRPPGPYATNRNEQSRAAAAETSSSTSRYATSFTTASNPATHQLTSVLLGVAAEAGVSPRVAIHADASGSPAASAVTNGTLTAPADVSDVLGAPERAEFTASPAISLAGGITYWVVLDVGSGTGSLSVSTTGANDNDRVPRLQWRLGDTMKAYSGSSWSDDSEGRSFRMALNGPTDQYIGPPFQLLREVRIGLPQVGVGVAAKIQDQSFRVKNATWQWQRGETSDGTFTDIPAEQGGTSRVYVPAAADLGKWLKALASYENAFGPANSLSGVSGQAVFSQPIMSNAGQISSIGYGLQQPDTVNIAQAFTTGGNPSGYSLSGLRFGIRMDTDADADALTDALSWALHADADGEPAAEPLFTHIAVPSDSLDGVTSTFEDLVHPGFPLAPDTKYWAVLTSSPLMEGTENPTLFVAGISEKGENVILDGPAAELDPGSESGWTLDFSALSSPQDPMSTEEWVRFTKALQLEPNGKMVLRMSVLTHPEVTASFGQAAHTVAEGGTQSVTVTLSADPERTVTIPIVTMGQDGASSIDYSGTPDSVTFNAGGPTEMTFTFTATQDTVDDEGESVLLGFGSDLSGGVSAGTPDETTLTITDDDPPEVSFGQSAYTVAEGGTVSVEVKLTSVTASAVTVPVTHTPQGATSSTDYSGVPANVMFSAGETSKAFTFTATQDTVDDDGESVLLTFGTLPATVQTGTTTQSTVTITDDDAPEVSFGQSAYTVAEGGTVSVEVKLTSALGSAVTVPVTHTPQGATSSDDYSGVPANVMFSAGETSKAFTFTATQDMVDDDGESVLLTFGTLPPAVRAGTPDETTVNITDDDIPSSVEVSFGSAAYTVTEGGTVEVTVILDDDPERTVTVPIGTINEGGASGSDYSGVPATVTFSSGETEKTFTVTATEDNLEDGGEGVKLSFVNLPPEATLGTTNEATVTIINKAAQNSLTVAFQSVAYSVPEGNSVVVTVILSAAPGSEVTVPLTVTEQGGATSEDYSGVPASVTFGPDERDQTFTVSATQDVVDDDEESVVIGFGTLSDGVREGGAGNTTVDIRDDDDPAVVVSFGSATYTVAEGGTVEVTVTLSADPERTVTIPMTKVNQGTASDADYSGVPSGVTFQSGETERSIIFSATQDTIDDDEESVRLGFGSTLPDRVSAGATSETVVSITDDDVPSVAVRFEQGTYTVAEGGTVEVTVTLSADPERTVVIPITKVNQGTASDADYSGVPSSVTFQSGETEKSITFTSTQDLVDDDGESVRLGFGSMPDARVSAGTPDETTVNITDDDAAAVKVALALTPATINESGTGNASTVTASIPSASSAATTVTVSVNPADTTTLTGNTTLTIPAGETDSTGVVTITAVNDDAYTGNRTVAVSGTAVNSAGITDPDDVTLTIIDDDIPAGCESGDIWCGTVRYADRFPSDAAGRKPLRWYHLDSDVPEFAHNELRYKVYSSSLGSNPGGGTYVMPPFHIPERSKSLFGLGNLSATDPMGHWEMPNQDYLDWTLYISTTQDGATLEAKLPFNEAKFCCGHKWRWYGLDLYKLNVAWAAGKEYKLRIVADPRADRTPEVLGPPLYLEARGVQRESAHLHWVRPQVRNDGAPPDVRYKVQWKTAAGMWDMPAVSEQVYVPPPGEEVPGWTIMGLTPGSAYDVRVIAVNDAGDSAPSNVLRVHTDEPPPSQNQAANSPATGGPGIIGSLLAGETLTATTENIEDEDGLTEAVFAYQWVRSNTDIEGEISSTYTMTDDDEGKAIQVRVTFSDDAGNEESLTSDAMAVAAALRLRSATLDGATLTLTYNDTLDSFVTLPQAAFTVSVNGGSRSVNAVSVAGASVTLTLASAAQAGDAVTVDYAKPNGPDFIRDTQGRVASSFSGRAVSNDTPATALTAAIHDAPGSHDGQEDFTFELRFSEEPKEGFSDVTLRDHAFTVTRGTVVGARRLDSDSDTPNIRWEISVSPDSNADVTVELPATEDCEAQGAICTEDDTMLSSPLEFTVKGPPLTASVESAPPSHNGSGEFRFRIAFSEEPKTGFSYTTMRDHAFTVTGGSVKGARRLESGKNQRWEITVKPDSNGDVTVVLPVTTDCAAQGAICTGDGRPLSNRLEITVSGPSG